jgi:hypothetical protein
MDCTLHLFVYLNKQKMLNIFSRPEKVDAFAYVPDGIDLVRGCKRQGSRQDLVNLYEYEYYAHAYADYKTTMRRLALLPRSCISKSGEPAAFRHLVLCQDAPLRPP